MKATLTLTEEARAKLNYGVIHGESIADYHTNLAWSKSKLDDFIRQPLYAKRKHIDKTVEEQKEEEHFLIGHSAHTLILEGAEAYHERYVIEPDFGDCRFKENKAKRDAWRADPANTSRALLTVDQARLNNKLLASVQSNALARLLLSQGKPEITWRAKLQHFDIQCRTDWFIDNVSQGLADELRRYSIIVEPGASVVVDFKTAATLDESEFGNFERHFFEYGYYRQAPFYQGVIAEVIRQHSLAIKEPNLFLFIATEKKEPFETNVFNPTPAALNLGWKEMVGALGRLKDCYASGEWPGMDDSRAHSIDVPSWYVRKTLGGAS